MGKFLLENAANLGKMNHSHFIWTSVLTPPAAPPPRPDFHSFVTVLLQVVQVAGGSGVKKECHMEIVQNVEELLSFTGVFPLRRANSLTGHSQLTQPHSIKRHTGSKTSVCFVAVSVF